MSQAPTFGPSEAWPPNVMCARKFKAPWYRKWILRPVLGLYKSPQEFSNHMVATAFIAVLIPYFFWDQMHFILSFSATNSTTRAFAATMIEKHLSDYHWTAWFLKAQTDVMPYESHGPIPARYDRHVKTLEYRPDHAPAVDPALIDAFYRTQVIGGGKGVQDKFTMSPDRS